MPRRISEERIEAAILESQHQRHDARLTDPSWTPIESDDALGGLVWRRAAETAVLTNMTATKE